MANNNENLSKANKAKKDEFYTQLVDIENELRHYKEHFKGKTVLCNCDDPYESNFVKYFAMNFNALGLKKLIATSYATSPVMYTQLTLFGDEEVFSTEGNRRKPYVIEIDKVSDENGDGAIDLQDFELILKKNKPRLMNGDGDFRSQECISFLKEADIVVTNPPFSLFREYVAQLVAYDKKFLIIGNQNAITYKEIFPLIKENKLWLGYGFSGNVGFFDSPYEDIAVSSQHKEGKIRISGVMWFTNLDITKRHEEMILYKTYTHEEYPTYDNYDAINVNKTADIPCNYYGMMGVPITFLDKYNPEQFEIFGITQRNDDPFKIKKYTKEEYANANDLNARACILVNGTPKSLYARILIKRR